MEVRIPHAPSTARPAAKPAGRGIGARLAATAAVLLAFVLAWLPAQADGLAPGEFRWMPELAPTGDDTVVIVSLPEQRAHVYRNGVRIGVSTVSTGKAGKETPTGVFPILQKRKEHYSNLYDNAPMPYMQRLTWDGVALHAGKIPGYPASNGCVRLPREFARKLFEATGHGTLVVVADYASHGPEIVSPGDRSPVDPATGIAWATPQAPDYRHEYRHDYRQPPAQQGVAGIDRVEVLQAAVGSRGDGIGQ
jgi:hypothetical protein